MASAAVTTSQSNLLSLLGKELLGRLADLDKARIMGPWRGRHPVDLRGAKRFDPLLYDPARHVHPHAELCLLLEGACRFSLAGQGSVLAAGDLVVCPPGVPHGEVYATKRRAYRLAWWSFSENDPCLHITCYTPAGGYAMEHRMSFSSLPADGRRRLAVLSDLASFTRQPGVDALREALVTLALSLYRQALAGGAASLHSGEPLVKRALEIVRQSHGQPLSLAAVAQAVHVSPNYLTSLFRQVTGKSLGRVILEERMARAEGLLRQPDLSIKEIAAQLGFSDSYTFSRAFKSYSGRAPTAWRDCQ